MQASMYRTLPLKRPCQISAHSPFLPKSFVISIWLVILHKGIHFGFFMNLKSFMKIAFLIQVQLLKLIETLHKAHSNKAGQKWGPYNRKSATAVVYYVNKNNSMKHGEGIVLKNRSLDQEESRSIRSSSRRSWCKHTFQPEQLSTQQQQKRIVLGQIQAKG